MYYVGYYTISYKNARSLQHETLTCTFTVKVFQSRNCYSSVFMTVLRECIAIYEFSV
jgi:hypothetical protein